jgi:hypothetical protein
MDPMKRENGNGMATVRIALALAGLLGIGTIFADGNVSASKAKPAAAAKADSKSSSKSAKASDRKEAGKERAVPGRMQVEEPDAAAFPKAPASAARESKAWQKSHARGGLTEAQKQAFRERKEKMEGWIAVIKEKRRALAAAKPEERAAIARELHALMLEKDPGNVPAAGVAARLSTDNSASAGDKQDGLGADAPNSVKKDDAEARKQPEARREELRKIQADRYKTGGNGSYRGGRDDDD